MNDEPVAKDEPPADEAYQLIVPELALAPKTTVPVPHLLFGLTVIVGTLLIVMIAVEDPAS